MSPHLSDRRRRAARAAVGPGVEPVDAASGPARDDLVVVSGLVVEYDGVAAIDGVDLAVHRGEHLAVVGPSGCGKSTLVRAVAGLVGIVAGEVRVAGRLVAGPGTWVPPEERSVGVVFQDHALFGHLDVTQNVAFGLRGHPDVAGRVAEVLELVGLADKADRHPHQLSGGEQQRVALARTLAPRPDVVLLDEPFSNLDRNLRERIRQETAALLRSEGVTAIFVTHDRDEAMAVGDRVAVLRDGRMEQVDTPEAVYHSPASRFVATFLDEAAFVRGRVEPAGLTRATTRFGTMDIRPVDGPGAVDVMVRAHEVVVSQAARGNAEVVATHFRGGEVAHVVRLDDDGLELTGMRAHTEVLPVGSRVAVTVAADHPLASFPRPGTLVDDRTG